MSENKPSLKERLANLRASKTNTHKEAKTRVASAWTLAKSMLPTAPVEIQYKLASTLLANSTKALTSMLRQTAINAHYTKVAEKFEQIHKIELNEFLENESVLSKLQNEIKSELKGEAKNASDSTDYEKDPEAWKAKHPGQLTPPPSELPVTSNKKASECSKCKGAGCEECEGKKIAAPENEELPPMNNEAPLDNKEIPAEGSASPEEAQGENEVTDLPPTDETAPEAPAEGVIPDAKKEELNEKIENLEADIQVLEDAVEGEEELDFSKIFDEDDMEDKTDSLANEDEGTESDEEDNFEMESADAGAQFFTDADVLEGTLDGQEPTTDMSDFFPTASLHATASLDSMLADSKTSSKDIVEKGELGQEWLDEGGVPDAEEDHEDSVLYEVLKTLKTDKYDPGAKRETEPKLEAPKNARVTTGPVLKVATRSKDGKPMRSLGNVKTATRGHEDRAMLAALVFPGDNSEW